MQKYQMQIKLHSDLCVSDGGVYNSAIDTDVCYDRYGFPYIPGKRLKGCLREAALELADWGEKIEPGQLFGEEGNQAGKIRIGNAYLADAGKLEELVGKYEGHLLVHPQNILKYFTYIRTQTSIDPQTGAAEENSLRTTRVVKKGNIFVADVFLEDDLAENEEMVHFLKNCCKVLRHMGNSRTRGMGEIEVSLKENGLKDEGGKGQELPAVQSIEKDSTCLEYEILLHEPVICKSVNGEEENTMDYIEGAKILGLLVKLMRKNSQADADELLKERELKCSNAYLSDGVHRMTEVPASIYSVKSEKDEYADRIYQNPDAAVAKGVIKQLKPMKHCYVYTDENEILHTRAVEVEERYHHRRPEDKSIGRAAEDESGDSKFYQISAIMQDQKFRGFIMAPPELLQKICKCIGQNKEISLGYGRASEYGAASWRVVGEKTEEDIKKQTVTEFVVKLEAPVILYSDNAVYTVDQNILAKEAQACLGIEEDEIKSVQKFINYTTVGGFQVTWGRRKPVIEAFDKGTVLYYQCNRPVEVPVGKTIWLGERLSEGYGEAAVQMVNQGTDREFYRKKITETGELQAAAAAKKLCATDSGFLEELCRHQFMEYMLFTAGSNAWKDVKKAECKKEALKSTVSNLLVMCGESESKKAVDIAAESRFGKLAEGKKDKLTAWRVVNRNVTSQAGVLLENFMEEYQIEKFSMEHAEIEFLYLKEYLKQLKYALRQEKGRK